jgi:plastocyanin
MASMKFKLVLFSLGIFAAMSLLGANNLHADPATTQKADSALVKIEDFAFEPKVLTITVGTTVTWTNADDVPHTATAKGDSPLFDSKALDTDDKFSFAFTKPGTYDYYCKVHPHMSGAIIVK